MEQPRRPSRDQPLQVDVWIIDLDAVRDTDDALRADVAPADILYATKAAAPLLGRRRLAGRAVLRRILSRFQHEQPSMLTIESGPFGKPRLVRLNSPPLAFNMTRSRNMAAVAVAKCDSLGIDLEHEAGPVADFASSILSRDERAAWAALPSSQRDVAVYRAWVRKEALLKGLGCGLTQAPDQIEVPLLPARLCRPNSWPSELAVDGWQLADLSVRAGIVGSLSFRAPNLNLCITYMTEVDLAHENIALSGRT
jgi:4'-phosphopantetheinyl transferase